MVEYADSTKHNPRQMQPYYIHATKKDSTKHPFERHAYNTNKASQIPRTPLRYTTHMETAY